MKMISERDQKEFVWTSSLQKKMQPPQQLNTFTQQRHSFTTHHHEDGMNGGSSVSIPMPSSTTHSSNIYGSHPMGGSSSSSATTRKAGRGAFSVIMKRIWRLCCTSSSSRDKLSLDNFLSQDDNKSAKSKPSTVTTRMNRCCVGIGISLIVFLMMCYWFVYVWNAPYYRLEASGPLIHEKEAPLVADKRYLIKTRTYPSFWMVTLSPQKVLYLLIVEIGHYNFDLFRIENLFFVWEFVNINFYFFSQIFTCSPPMSRRHDIN